MQHTHSTYVEGCYRCDLGRDEEAHAAELQHRAIEYWCDRNRLVMKDFPDNLIDEAIKYGDPSILSDWLQDNEPRTARMWD